MKCKYNLHSERGSALLVVLGMLSFMLFSGLAFSVYMRQSRLPTSFLRRTATTRQLAKAALAEAIDHVDRAIGNDPHPGVHVGTYQNGAISNIWSHRVFIGIGTTSKDTTDGSKTDSKSVYPAYASPDRTVPTLTLEGLAYLPPNLINEARYYSQRTPTAKWHSFWFDSGRYAYTAIDVSDYFDVNRMFADKPRAACGSRRISFAHIFEEGADHASAGSGATQWDNFMKQYRTVKDADDTITYNLCPFVSMADFNIAWGSQEIGGLKCPFYNFVKNGQAYDCGDGVDDPEAEPYRCMTFVTDGWYPTATGNTTAETKREKRDLCAYQPFRQSDMESSSMPSLPNKVFGYSSDIVNAGGNGADLGKHLCQLGIAQLWDYLDFNRVPVSLAVPTLERVPMIVGIEPTSLPSVKFAETHTDADLAEKTTETEKWKRRTQQFSLVLADSTVVANVLAAYPFRSHGVDEKSANFTIDGRMSLFFTIDGENMTMRPGTANEALHLTKNQAIDKTALLNKSVMAFALRQQSVAASSFSQQADRPVKKVSMVGDSTGIGETKVLTVVYDWLWQRKEEVNGEMQWVTVRENPETSDIVSDGNACDFFPLTANGSLYNGLSSSSGIADFLKNGGKNIRANAAVWIRVRHNDEDMGEKIVDLVPACVADDDELNGAKNRDGMTLMIGGTAYPIMRFDVTADGGDQGTIKLNVDSMSGSQVYKLTPNQKKVVISDPRFNHQPENWYALDGALAEDDWITETAKMVGQDGRDADFFMFTSDQGIMQSVYELAFLLRLTGLSESSLGNGIYGNYPIGLTTRTSFETDYTKVKDYDVMWRTYRCYDSGGQTADPFEEIGLTCGESGPKVNPYSDSKKVLMAAFANTPHDWRVASTNNEDVVDMKAAEFNKKHAWNAYSTETTGKTCWDCLEEFAEKFQDKVRTIGDWEDAFAELDWSTDKRKLLDSIELDGNDADLYMVDKKFLYGFWHDSFAARQQLFLIFVRAEPMMMGGGVQGQVPPQLGARAVALVWRDPTATTGTRTFEGLSLKNPHRTRILFYHQFD